MLPFGYGVGFFVKASGQGDQDFLVNFSDIFPIGIDKKII